MFVDIYKYKNYIVQQINTMNIVIIMMDLFKMTK